MKINLEKECHKESHIWVLPQTPLVHQLKSRPIISRAHTPHHKDLFLKNVKYASKLMLEKKNLEISPHEPYILLMLPTLSSKFFNVTITKDKDCNHLILKLYIKKLNYQ